MRTLLVFVFILAFAMAARTQTHMAEQLFDEGTQAAKNIQFEKAIESYQKAILLTNNDESNDAFLAKLHSNIGICLYRLQRTEAAIDELKKAVRFSKGQYQPAFYALGMAYSEVGNWNDAVSAFRRSIALKEEDGEAWFDLASALLHRKDLRAAEFALKKSIKYKTVASHDAHNNLGVLLAWRGDLSAAEGEFGLAFEQSDGASAEAKHNLRLCRFYRQNSQLVLIGGMKLVTRSNLGRQI